MNSLTSIDLAEQYGETTLTHAEVYGIGEALLGWIGAVVQLGHASPAGTLDYTQGAMDNACAYIVRDFVAWTSGRLDTVPGDPEERLRDLVNESHLSAELASRIGRAMGGAA